MSPPLSPQTPTTRPRVDSTPVPSPIKDAATGGSSTLASGRSLQFWLRSAVMDNLALKTVAFILAVTVFILVSTDRDAVIGAYVGISYTMPEDRVLVSQPVDQIRVTLRGPWRRIKRFDERALPRVRLDLRDRLDGEYAISAEMIALPQGLELRSIEPATIPLRFEERVSKRVPVAVATTGGPARGYEVSRLGAKPQEVTVRGAASVLSRVTEVRTRKISLDGRSEEFSETVSLVAPQKYVEFVDKAQVEVMVSVVEAHDRPRRVGPLRIEIRPEPGVVLPASRKLVVIPAEVTLHLYGSMLVLESIVESEMVAYVLVGEGDLSGPRGHEKVVMVDTPRGVGKEIHPRTVLLRRQ